jgi:hypothetical protein
MSEPELESLQLPESQFVLAPANQFVTEAPESWTSEVPVVGEVEELDADTNGTARRSLRLARVTLFLEMSLANQVAFFRCNSI